MPIPALLGALARLGTATARVGVTVARSAARAAAASARALGRATARFARAVTKLARRAAMSAARAARRALAALKRSVLRLVEYTMNRIRAAGQKARSVYTHLRGKVAEDVWRLIDKAFNNAVVQSNESVEETIRAQIEDPPDTRAKRMLRVSALRYRLAERFAAVVRDIAQGTEAEDLMRVFREHVAPEIAAARIVATEDPTAVLDEDTIWQLALAAEKFVEMASRVADDVDRVNLVGYLVQEGVMAAKAAAYRQVLLAQAVRDRISVDTDMAVLASVTQYATSESAALSDEELALIDSVVSSVLGYSVTHDTPTRIMRIARLLSRSGAVAARLAHQYLTDVARAGMRQQHMSAQKYAKILADELTKHTRPEMPSRIAALQPATENEQIDSESERERPDAEPETGEEDDVLYGVWETQATRTVQESCPDCAALEALTSMYPVPVAELPTPGVETMCASMCACAIRVVQIDEHDAIRGQWSSVWERMTGESMPARFERGDVRVFRLAEAILGDGSRLRRWANALRIDESDEME